MSRTKTAAVLVTCMWLAYFLYYGDRQAVLSMFASLGVLCAIPFYVTAACLRTSG